ncbi:hypothetical protein DOO74_09335 [Rhodobacteraceae bacterium AsT-22]|nr:hypothetical protein DOO74_09335 [Rhodobacteraceae bacterium AsT-22]
MMTMALIMTYLVSFAAGPLIFLGLVRARPSRGRVLIGAVSVVGLMVMAWVLRGMAQGPVLALAWLACLWLGWVVMIATAVQAARLRMQLPNIRKWSAAAGAVATGAPWFGLSLAMGT